MIAPTHITFAELVYLLLLTTTGVALNTVNAMMIAFASILADVDTAASLLGRSLPFISKPIERKFGHRTLTHSLGFIGALAIFLSPVYLISSDTYTCILVGYASHPFLDTMTVNGVKLFYPFSTAKCVFPLEVNNPHRYRLQTGSKMDKTLGVLFLIGCIPTYLIAHQGYERFIRSTQKNIESAVRDYNEFSMTHMVFADLLAYDMMTKEHIEGTFEILGTLNDRTVLFKAMEGRAHSLGKEYEAEYVAERILCRRGDLAQTVVRSVDMSSQLLSQILVYLDLRFDNSLFGVLSSSDPVSIPQESKAFTAIAGSFGSIRFNYATYGDIQRFNLENIFITKGSLTIRTIIPSKYPLASSDTALGGYLSIMSLPRPSDSVSFTPSFSQISFQIDPKENVEFLLQKGDTVREGEIIAKRDLALFFDRQIALDRQKIASLEEDLEYTLAETEQKLSQARETMQKDSIDLVHVKEVLRNGFVSELAVIKAQKKFLDSWNVYSHLLAAQSRVRAKFNLQIQRLKNEIDQLRSKEKAATKRSEIRSTTDGIIYDIRQVYHNNKLQVTFVIRRPTREYRPKR